MNEKTPMKIQDLPDIFGMNELKKVYPICHRLAYELVKDPSFPSFRSGKKILISKAGFLKWLEQKQQEKMEAM